MLSEFKYYKFIFILILLILISCQDNKIELNELMKNYMCNELNSSSLDDSCFNIKCNIKSKYTNYYRYEFIELRTLYLSHRPSNNRVDRLFRYLSINNNKDLLIEYPDYSYNKIIINSYNNIIIIRKEYKKACYIKWTTVKFKLKPRTWLISKYTDTVISNLSKNFIIKMFPAFEGIFIKRDISQINIDFTKYLPWSVEGYDTLMNESIRKFYDNIEFVK